MSDPFFEGAVVLLCQHDDDGAFGLIINRPGSLSISQVASAVDVSCTHNGSEMTWWGGPVGQGACFIIWRGEATQEEGWTISENIAVSQSLHTLRRLVDTGEDFHVTVGYSGWESTQLETEISTGSWLYVEADPQIVFDLPMNQRYDAALALLGLTRHTVWMTPINE